MNKAKVNYIDINNNKVSFSKKPADICFFNVNNERYFIYAITVDNENKEPESKLFEFNKEEYEHLLNSNTSYVELKLDSCEEIYNIILQSKLETIEEMMPAQTLGEYLGLE